jgi:hypothetical protein
MDRAAHPEQRQRRHDEEQQEVLQHVRTEEVAVGQRPDR